MNPKLEINDADFLKNSIKIMNELNNNNTFLFYFNHDPDAIGSSLALALFLQHQKKESIIYLPGGTESTLDFILDIVEYNHIIIEKDINKAEEILRNKKPVIITTDTATHLLLPNFDIINKLIIEEKLITIEIDHHFGGDSENVYNDSITLFKNTNSTCEIIAEFLEFIGKEENENLDNDIIFPRNIVLSLLVGICFDTQLGKFVNNKKVYNKWFDFLSERLEWLTWGSPKIIRSAMQVFEAINKISRNKRKIISDIVKNTKIINKVGLLMIPPYEKYQSLDKNGDPTCILAKIIPDLANKVPEYSGTIGITAFFDTVLLTYFIKVRRSYKFKKYDLRNCETSLKNLFGDKYLGGGGHEGATSFRVSEMDRSDFIKKIKLFHNNLAKIVEEVLFNTTS